MIRMNSIICLPAGCRRGRYERPTLMNEYLAFFAKPEETILKDASSCVSEMFQQRYTEVASRQKRWCHFSVTPAGDPKVIEFLN